MRQVLFYAAFLVFSFSVKAQPIPFLEVDEGVRLFGFTINDFIIPDGVLQIEFEAVGADGGSARFVQTGCAAPGGKGASGRGIVIVGNGPDQVPPGSIIRFIPGDSGEDGLMPNGPGSAGGGGGGSAIIYKSNTMFTFEPICVAGGGGGAAQGNFLGLCTDHSPGQPGQASQNGANGTGLFSGLGGINLLGGASAGGGGGGGANGEGGGFGCINPLNFDNPIGGGGGTWENGGVGGNQEYCSVTPTVFFGGGGYGGGGGGQMSELLIASAGGGGGYCGGGGGGTYGAGGGGGSYLKSGVLFPSLKAGTANPNFDNNNGFTYYRCITDALEAGQNLYNDFAKPVARCKDITVFLNDIGTLHLFPEQMDNGTTDDSPITFSSSRTAFNCSDINKVFSISMFVKDIAGNTSACQSQVTVLDNAPPLLQCKPKTLFLDANGTVNVVQNDVVESAADNCGVTNTQITPNVFNCSHLGPNLVTVVAKDASNNSTTCSSTVTVVDAMPPTLVCRSFTAKLNALGVSSVNTADVLQSGTDNCGIVNQLSVLPNAFNCSHLGDNLVKLTVDDSHGNTSTCTASVTVADPIAPTMFCKNATISLNSAGQATLSVAQINNGSFDNCGITTIGLSQTIFTCAHLGANTVILGGADASINKGQCNATVTVLDQIKPIAKCKNVIANLDANGTVTVPSASVNNGSLDNCSITMDLSPNTFGCNNVGLNTVKLTVTDAGGNTAACTAKVTVKDNIAPIARCKNATVLLNELGQANLSIDQVDNNSSDNCAIKNASLQWTQFNCSEVRETPWLVAMTLKDAANNTSSCIASVTVKDLIPPNAECESISVHLGENGLATVFGAELATNSTDNCFISSFFPVAKVYTAANLGLNSLVVTTKDQSGNTASCTATVTVLPFENLQAGQGRSADSEDIPTDLNLRLFPNPSAGAVRIEFGLPKEQAFRLRVFDLAGRLVLNWDAQGVAGENNVQIPAKTLIPGVYTLDFQTTMLKTKRRLIILE